MKEIAVPQPVELKDPIDDLPLADQTGRPLPPMSLARMVINAMYSEKGYEAFCKGLEPFEGPELAVKVARKFKDASADGHVHLEDDEYKRVMAALPLFKQHPIMETCSLPLTRALREAKTVQPAVLTGKKSK
jgi:hypothetical protein